MHSLSSSRSLNWVNVFLVALMFWFSSSLLMDLVVMPGLFVSGMLSQPQFAPAGYTLFWLFNRLELLAAAVVLTGLLVHRQYPAEDRVVVSGLRSRWAVEVALALLAITLVVTYGLSPAMGALGLALDPFATGLGLPEGMNQLHGFYFGLEALKLVGCGALLKFYFQDLGQSQL
ncbi:MAG: hypothetical protein KGQ93_06660 [Cyanobacteria bacterium REEB459]|nr:hypothetical protein [Cyanobacteria bacterium REEB459]